jgi:hypothetical protein
MPQMMDWTSLLPKAPAPIDVPGSIGQWLQNQNAALKMQAARQAIQSDQQLRSILGNPQNLNQTTGLPTPQAMSQIGQASPQDFLAFQEAIGNQYLHQQNIAKQAMEMRNKLADESLEEINIPAQAAYDDVKAKGGSDADARKAANDVRRENWQKFAARPGMPSDLVAMGNREVQNDFDPERNLAIIRGRKPGREYLKEQTAEKRAERQDDRTKYGDEVDVTFTDANGKDVTKIARLNKDTGRYETIGGTVELIDPKSVRKVGTKTDEGTWQVLTDPSNNQQYRYNPATAKATTMTGEPYTPGGAAKISQGAGALLDDRTLHTMAEQYLAGDRTVFQNLGRGAQGAENVVKLRGEVARMMAEQGKSGAEIATKIAEFEGLKAGERALGTRTAQMGMALNEAKTFAPLALQASEKVDRTSFPTLNSLLLAAEKGTGGEDVIRLSVATNSLLNAYARAVTPTGTPTEGAQERARQLLDAAWSKGQFRTAIDQLMKEMEAASKAPGMVREEFRERKDPGSSVAAPATTGAPTQSSGGASVISSKSEYDALPSGAKYRKPNDPEGYYRTKP